MVSLTGASWKSIRLDCEEYIHYDAVVSNSLLWHLIYFSGRPELCSTRLGEYSGSLSSWRIRALADSL